jgi:hypothetical protein
MAKPIHKQLEQTGAASLPEGRTAPEAPTAEELSKRWGLNAGGVGVLAVIGAVALKALKLGVLLHFVGALGWGFGGLAIAAIVLAGIAVERLVAHRRQEHAQAAVERLGRDR